MATGKEGHHRMRPRLETNRTFLIEGNQVRNGNQDVLITSIKLDRALGKTLVGLQHGTLGTIQLGSIE
jgi:hypothetical protein